MGTKRKQFLEGEKARRMYVVEGFTIPEICKHFGVALQTIYTLHRREKWDLIREAKSDELIRLRMDALTEVKAESMEFYHLCLQKCMEILPTVKKPMDLKFLIDSRIMAENRILLIAGEELEKKAEEKSKGDGILDELARL